MYFVKVKHKGQVTLPVEIRRKLGIDEGCMLEVVESAEGILMRPIPPVEGGVVVGEEKYRKVIKALEMEREAWQ